MSFVTQAVSSVSAVVQDPTFQKNFKSIREGVTAVTGLFGSFTSASAKKQVASARSSSFNFNAAVLANQAVLIRQRTALDIQRQRIRARRLAGSQRAAFAKAGVRLSGSALEVITDDAAILLLDQEITRANEQNQLAALETDRQNQLRRAELAERAGDFRFASSLLSAIPRAVQLR